jgi:hypothetical protein
MGRRADCPGGDGGAYAADGFYEGVALLEERKGAEVSALLGAAIAHELGHLLLGKDSHAAAGLMRLVWTAGELAAASKGRLTFTEEQGRRLRASLDGQFAAD